MIWCVDRASTDSPDPWAAALLGHARLFQGGIVKRFMVDGRMIAWELVKVTYGDPDTAPTSGGSAVPFSRTGLPISRS